MGDRRFGVRHGCLYQGQKIKYFCLLQLRTDHLPLPRSGLDIERALLVDLEDILVRLRRCLGLFAEFIDRRKNVAVRRIIYIPKLAYVFLA